MTNGAGSDVVGHFRAGFQALTRYPILIVPPLAAQVLAFLLMFVVMGGAVGMGALMGGMMGGMAGGREGAAAGGMAGLLGGVLLFGFLFAVVLVLISLLASGVVVVMSREALATREPVIGSALGAVMARLADVIVASVFVSLIVGVGMILLVVPGLLAAFFLMFALPAVLLDGQGGVDGLRRSFRLVKENLGPALGFVIGAILVSVAAWIVAAVVGLVPVLGHLASAIVFGVLISYLTVVAVRVYQSLPRH